MLDTLMQFWETHLLDYAHRLLMAALIALVGYWLTKRVVQLLERTMERRGADVTISRFIGNLIQIALLAFVAIAALDQLGIETTSIVAILGAAGLAIGLALKDSLSNFAAGVMLIMFRPFKAGDFVEAGGTAGVVQSVRTFATLFKTGDNRVITVPNSAIMGGNIVNFSAEATRRIDLLIGVSYRSDLAKTRAVLRSLVEADERILKDPAPTIAVAELADSSIQLVVRPWVASADYWAVRWDLLEAVKTRFDQEGIEIPFPQIDVHWENITPPKA